MKTVWTAIILGVMSATTCFSQDLTLKSFNTSVGNSDDVTQVTSGLGKINNDSVYYLLDSVAVFSFNAETNDWNPCLRKEIELTKEGLVANVTELKYNTHNKQWTESSRESFTYNQFEELTNHLVQVYNIDTKQWENKTQKSISRSNGGQKVSIRFNIWDSNEGNWVAQWEQVQSFDSEGNPLRVNTNKRLDGSDELQNYWQYVYLYDSNDELEMVFQYEWDQVTNKWKDIWQSNYSKNNEGNVVTKLSEWNEAENNWSEFRKYTTEADDYSNQSLTIRKDWDDTKGEWSDKRRISEYFSESDTTLQVLDEEWDEEMAAWTNRQSLKSTYSSKGIELERETAIWNNNNWSSDFKTSYHYTEVIVKQKQPEMDNDFYVYPNPVVDVVHLANVTERSVLTIYSMSGAVLSKKTVDEYDASLNISQFEKGVYLFTLSNIHGEQTVKVIKK